MKKLLLLLVVFCVALLGYGQLSIVLEGEHPLCNITTGSIYTTVLGGTPPYIYNWNTGSPDKNLINIFPGTYMLEVFDADLNSAHASYTISEPLDLSLTINPSAYSMLLGESVTLTCNATFNHTYDESDLNYIWSTGETTSSIMVSPNTSTTYRVYAEVHVCSIERSIYIEVPGTSSIYEPTLSITKISPNPSTGEFIINFDTDTLNTTIEVIDVNGKLVHQSSINQTDYLLNLKHLSKGIYYLNILNNKEAISQKKLVIIE